MTSYITKKKKNSKIDVICATCRNKVFKGYRGYLLQREQRRFSVGKSGYIDFISGGPDENAPFGWLEKEYGVGKMWNRFNTDDIGVE